MCVVQNIVSVSKKCFTNFLYRVEQIKFSNFKTFQTVFSLKKRVDKELKLRLSSNFFQSEGIFVFNWCSKYLNSKKCTGLLAFLKKIYQEFVEVKYEPFLKKNYYKMDLYCFKTWNRSIYYETKNILGFNLLKYNINFKLIEQSVPQNYSRNNNYI